MNRKIIYQLLSLIFLINLSTYAIDDPRLTRDVVIDIDATLTTCCAQIDADFNGTFSVIAEIALLVQGCSPQFIGQADVGTTGFVISTSGVYKLSENIVFNPAGLAAAITINADNVMLDLQCFNITQGNATALVDGISIGANHTNIMINSGRIKNFSRDGIRVASGSSNLAYADITIQNCLYGIFCLGTGVAPIEIIRAVGLDLISNSTGVSLTFVNRAQLAESSWYNSAYAGVELINSFSNSITSCIIEKTGSATGSAVGISMVQGGDNRVESCSIDGVSTNDTFSGNSAVGILLGETENDDLILNNKISNCSATSNAQPFGIEMLYSFTSINLVALQPVGIEKCVWSPNGRYIATSTNGLNLTMYEFKNNQLTTIQTIANSSFAIGWSPDSSFFAAVIDSGINKSLQIFAVNEGILSLVAQIAMGSSTSANLSWASDGKYIAVPNGSTANIFKFSGTALELVAFIDIGSTILDLEWSPDSNYVALASTSVFRVYRFLGNSLQLATSIARNTVKVSWRNDGQFIAVGDAGTNQLFVYRFLGTSIVQTAVSTQTKPTMVDWSPDGQYLAAIVGGLTGTNLGLRILKFTGTSLIQVFSINFSTIASDQGLNWSNLGNFIALGADANSFRIYSGFQFPSNNFIGKNEVSFVTGPPLGAGIPGVSSGRGISSSSANSLVIQNTAFDNDINYVFANNLFSFFVANADPEPSLISNISFPPL